MRGVAAALFSHPAGGEVLTFAMTHVSHEAAFGETRFETSFSFVATGDETAEIRGIRSSCGCTIPVLEKKRYAPGESGEIKVIFEYGSRLGTQHKAVYVETTAETYELSLEVEIPRPWAASSRVLFWNVGEPHERKRLTVDFNFASPVSFEGLDHAPADFALVAADVTRDGRTLTIDFVPQANKPTGIHRLEILARGAEGQEFRIPVYLRAL
jgi:hypothetical protein